MNGDEVFFTIDVDGVDVSISDKYRLQGSLYTKDERPIGTVSVVSKLSEGKQIIALDYYGKILYCI